MKKLVSSGKFYYLLLITYCLLLTSASFAQINTYPQLEISGYKKWEYKGATVNPSQNYYTGLTMLGGYYPTFTGGPWQERLQLGILGRLSEDLSVSYDLEQQPENPDRFDVKVKYQNNELTFGDYNVSFAGNEFASTSKYLNGVLFTAKESWYDVIFVPSTKLKSQTQGLTTQNGINTKGPYNLGHGSIIEGSEKIQLNNVPLTRNIDYTIDYFEGRVTFNKILTSADQFKYSYEYTNIIDLFFPALSKKDFIGLQTRFTLDPQKIGQPELKEAPVILADREIFPSLGSEESDEEQAEESSGVYQVKHFPVVRFSEHITFRGTELKNNVDYVFRFDSGEIKLLTRFLPSREDPLIVDYHYYQLSAESEMIQGGGGQGPYRLSFAPVVPDSEKIILDGRILVKKLDYSINYKTGELIFSMPVNATSQINANYQYAVMAKPFQPEPKYPAQLKLGATYLKESAKAGETANASTAIESFTGSTIINQNYHVYLSSRPVVSTGESFSVAFTLDGRTLTREVDYTFPGVVYDPTTGYYNPTPEATFAYKTDHTDPSDGYYFGTIKILNPSLISADSTAIVAYNYSKSVVGRYSASGDGTRGPYYLRTIRNVVPGSEVVQVWDQGSSTISTYTRNSSFEPNAGDTGYTINYAADLPYITFNNELLATKNFQIIYQYVPPTGSIVQQDIAQSIIGVDGTFNIGDIFKVDSAYARSSTDQYIVRVPTSEAFSGGGTKTYQLHAPQDIIDNSEKLYVNDQLVNRDIDYYFNYTAPGSLTFYYITPASSDAIRIDYDYQDSSGSGTVNTKTANAYRVGAETKLFKDVLVISGLAKKIDYDYMPLGGTLIGLGSEYNEYNVKYNPLSFHGLSAAFSYKEDNDPISTYQNYFTRTYDNSLLLGINPNGWAEVDFTYRNYRSLDDLTPAAAAHSSDTYQESYTLGLVPNDWEKGALKFSQGYAAKRTVSQTDSWRDSNNYSESSITYVHAEGNLDFTDRYSLGYDFQVSEPKTIALRSSSTEATAEAVSTLTRTYDNAYNFNADLTQGPIQKLALHLGLTDRIDTASIRNFASTNEAALTRNESFHLDFIPITILTAALDKSRQEKISLVQGGANPKTERMAANTRLSPFYWLSLNWANAQSENIPDTGIVNRTAGVGNTYTLDLKPSAWNILAFNARFTLYNNDAHAPSGTTPEVTTITNSFSQNYNLALTPLSILPISASWTLENYRNANDHPTVSSRIDTETLNSIYILGAAFAPTPKFNFTTNYNHKITGVLRDLVLSPQDRRKTVFDNKAAFQVTSWGTLVYQRINEHNGGEIQAGAVSDLDYDKITETYSFNINLPIDNPVVTSFVFIASLKNVDYKNNKSHGDDFVAQLMTFEGSLNF
ncbi:MAG: hypothetical protein QME05_01190 [Candidatus Margulisbacteria bacterium]|nr:hypothetical protein [Candidatus Margulisiibacteriota bacterium]